MHKARPDVEQKPDPWTECNDLSIDLTNQNTKDNFKLTHMHMCTQQRRCRPLKKKKMNICKTCRQKPTSMKRFVSGSYSALSNDSSY